MKTENCLSALRKTLLPASATAALVLAAGIVQAQPIFVTSTGEAGITPTETDNDFTRINNAIQGAGVGDTIELIGTFDLTTGHALDSYSAMAFPAFEIIGKDGLTITSDGTAEIHFPFLNSDGFYINNSDNVTVSNLTLDGATYMFYVQASSGTTSENLTITGNTIRVRHDGNVDPNRWFTGGVYVRPSGSNSLKNMLISENDFEVILHPALVNRLNQPGIFTNIYCFYVHNGQPFGEAADDGLQIVDNNIDIVREGEINSTDLDNPAGSGTNLRFFRDNSNSNSSNMTISGNTMNGGVTFSDGITLNMGRGISPASKSGEFQDPDPGSRIRFNDNTFINVIEAYRAWRGNAATDPELIYVLEDNVFIDCGIPTASPPRSVINPIGASQYSDGAPHGIRFNLDTQVIVGGNTLTGIPMLHYVGDPLNAFFEPSPGGGQFGVLNAEVIPPADPGDIVNNSDWTGFAKFSDPTGAGTLAMEYNAFGDPIDPGDPFIFYNDPEDNIVYELTEDEVFPVGTIIRAGQTVTIRSAADKAGHGDNYTVTPMNQSVTTPMFLLEDDTATLILEDVNLNGDVVGLFGDRDILSPFRANGGTIQLTNVHLSNFLDVVLEATDGATITATNTTITDAFRALSLRHAASSITFEDGHIADVARLMLFRAGGELNFVRNTVGAVTGMFSIDLPGTPTNALIGGAPADGNMFLHPITVFIDGVGPETGDVAAWWNMTHNWHFNVYGPDSNNDGLIDGSVVIDPLGAQTLNDGVRFFGSRGGNDVVETHIVATYDRDNDGLPDVLEFRLGTEFRNPDTSGNTVPDGVMVQAGLDPIGGDLPVGWDGDSFTADTNDSGYTDWHEAVIADAGFSILLGDVTGNDQVSLGDAIRALQLINGAVSVYVVPNPNNLNVAGANPFSLANPLQILRYQAGVRTTFPALPGID